MTTDGGQRGNRSFCNVLKREHFDMIYSTKERRDKGRKAGGEEKEFKHSQTLSAYKQIQLCLFFHDPIIKVK